MDVKMVVGTGTDVNMSVDNNNYIHASVDSFAYIKNFKDVYAGETHIAPTDSTIILDTAGMVVPDQIIIDPIPSNYGRIEWDGSTLTIV